MTVPSDCFSIRWEPIPRLTGHWRSLTSSTVPLKVASVVLSYLGTGSSAGFCQAAADKVHNNTVNTTSNTRQVFMFVLLPHRSGTLGLALLGLWRGFAEAHVIGVTSRCDRHAGD